MSRMKKMNNEVKLLKANMLIWIGKVGTILL